MRVRARDAVANTQTPTSRTFTFDATAPSAAVDFPQASEDYNAAGWDAGCATSGLCGTYSDATSGVAEVEVSIRRGTGNYWDGTGFTSASEVWNDATIAAGDWEYALDSSDFPAEGNYTVRVRATDNAGNTAAPSSLTFTYDTTAPQTTIDDGPASPTTSTDPSFEFSASEPGSTFECRRDGGAWSACTSPKDYTGLSDGSHTFDVRATDTAGNTDASPASQTWVIDTAAPSSTAAFPVASGNYTVAEWNAGCADERPLRHLLGRLRLRRRGRRGLHPPGLRRLLGRHRLHERLRGLERRHHRRRRLGVRLRRGELPRRRQLHGARPRA